MNIINLIFKLILNNLTLTFNFFRIEPFLLFQTAQSLKFKIRTKTTILQNLVVLIIKASHLTDRRRSANFSIFFFS